MKNLFWLIFPVFALALTSCSKEPKADFTASANVVETDAVVTFTDLSENATHYVWDFGDGTAVSTSRNPTHVFETPGTYTVTLEVQDRKSKRFDSFAQSIVVNPKPSQQADYEKQLVYEQMVGEWNFTRELFEYKVDGVVDPFSSFDLSYDNYTVEFISQTQMLRNDTTGNVWMDNWNLIDGDRVQISWQMFDIFLLGDNDMILKFETTQTFGGITYDQKREYYYSR